MIDWDRVGELKEEIGEADFDEVAQMFMAEVEDTISRLKTVDDRTALEEDLHFLKSSALNLGFAQMARLCQEGEHQAARGAGDSVELQPIYACYDASKAAFQPAQSTN